MITAASSLYNLDLTLVSFGVGFTVHEKEDIKEDPERLWSSIYNVVKGRRSISATQQHVPPKKEV